MTDEPRQGDDSSPVPPWERADRWNQDRPEVTRVDDLLARLGQADQPSRRRRRRAEDDETTSVSASDLIASLTGSQPESPVQPTQPAPAQPTERPAPTIAPVPSGTSATAGHGSGPATPGSAGTDPAVAPATERPSAVEIRPSATTATGDSVTEVVPLDRSGDTHTGQTDSAAAPARQTASSAAQSGTAWSPSTTDPGRPTQVGPAVTPEAPTVILPAYGATPAVDADAEAIRASLNKSVTPAVPVSLPAPDGPLTRPPHRAHSGPRAALYAARIVATVLSVVVLAATGMYSVIISRGNAALAENEVEAVVTEDPNIIPPTVVPPSQEASGPVLYAPENILLIGSDTRAGNNSEVGAGGEGAEGDSANSDTMMIAHLSADRQRVQVLSLPRDLLVEAPDNCHGWNFRTGEISDQVWDTSPGEIWQINSAFSVGGPKCLVLAVQKFTGIRIDRVIGIDFVGFADMVDALGGLTVNICRPVDDNELGMIVSEAGVQTIGGQQALNLVRARKVVYDEGRSDPARIERQQKVLSAILRQVTDAGTLFNPVTLDSFLQAFARNVTPDNVTFQDMVALADSLGDLSPGKVTFYALPTVPSTSRTGKLEADPDLAPAVFDAIINDLPLPSDEVQEVPTVSEPAPAAPEVPSNPQEPTDEPAPTTVTVAPEDVDLRVWNVTGRSGVAGDAQSALNDLGFDVTDNDLVRDDENVQDATTVVYGEADRAIALTVLAAVPGATGLVDNSLPSGEIRLMVGTEFDEVFAESVDLGDTVAEAGESTAEQAAPTTPFAPDTTTSAEVPVITSLAPSDIPAVNAGNTDCI